VLPLVWDRKTQELDWGGKAASDQYMCNG